MSFLLDLSNFPTLLVASGGLLAALVVIAVVAPKKRNPRGLPLPPGPKGLPIIGNTLQIPDFAKHPWEVYAALCKEYGMYLVNKSLLRYSPCDGIGDMVYLTAMGQGILVLSSLPRAVELLDKRAAVYSSRPSIPALDL
jgi:hypothetical protein